MIATAETEKIELLINHFGKSIIYIIRYLIVRGNYIFRPSHYVIIISSPPPVRRDQHRVIQLCCIESAAVVDVIRVLLSLFTRVAK